MASSNKTCQSCGMPLSRDPQGGGSEANGARSSLYCSHCYRMGAFVEPRLSSEEMIAKVKAKMKSMGFPGFLAWFFTRRIPKLQRWQGRS